MTSLKRTATGAFTLEQCIDLDALNQENICENILSEELAVSHLPTLFVSETQALRFSNGGKLSFDRLNQKVEDGEYLRVKYKDTFIGIGYADGKKKEIRIMCLINPMEATK